MKVLLLILSLSFSCFGWTDGSIANWSGRYTPCNRHADLLSQQPMNLTVRISTTKADLARQFRKALDFWSGVLDMEWREVTTEDCALQLVDGTPDQLWHTAIIDNHGRPMGAYGGLAKAAAAIAR